MCACACICRTCVKSRCLSAEQDLFWAQKIYAAYASLFTAMGTFPAQLRKN